MGRRRFAPDMRRIAPVALAAALAVVYLIWQPASLDLAAAEYRAWLFGHAGFTIWDAQWYGGHHLPGYSVVVPPLAHWLGPRLLGALAVVAAAWLFEQIAWRRFGPDAWLGATWFALGTASALYSGRITFLHATPAGQPLYEKLELQTESLVLSAALEAGWSSDEATEALAALRLQDALSTLGRTA